MTFHRSLVSSSLIPKISRNFGSKEEFSLMHELKDAEDWNTKVISSEKMVFLQASADWCKPCQALKPMMQKALKEHEKASEVSWVVFDIDQHKELAQMLQIQGVPTVYAVNNGQLLTRFVGVPEGTGLKDFINDSFEKAKAQAEQAGQQAQTEAHDKSKDE